MILWTYILGFIFTAIMVFKIFIKHQILDGWEPDAELVMYAGLFSILLSSIWPLSVIGFILHNLADNYAKHLNARKNDTR